MANLTIAQLFDLTGKVAIVTGAGMGIGQAIAVRLAEAGANMMITDINTDAANQTIEYIREAGGNVEFVNADAASIADAKKTVEATIKAFGRIDILVNNAGIFQFSSVLEINEDTWDRTQDINLKGMFFLSQVVAKEMMKAERGGVILNMASMDGIHPTRLELLPYNASKGGVIMLTKALALALAPYNITVNAIASGPMNTPGSARLAECLIDRGDPIEELTLDFMKRVPLGRLGEPDEIAKVALFLVTPGASYMTGSTVLVDGGYLLT